MNKLAIIILGLQGSGKGTQAAILSQKIKAPLIEMGGSLREEKSKDTHLGMIIASYIDKGSLVPDKVIDKLVEEKIKNLKDSETIIFEGVPRTISQKNVLDSILKEHGFNKTIVIYLEIDKANAIERLLKRGRHDDSTESIQKRFSWTEKETLPLINEYSKITKVIKINALPDIETIALEIMTKYLDATKNK